MEYDFTLHGDGSGMTADKPCGYAVTIFDKDKNIIKVISGSTSNDTNNFAELLPYLNAIWFLHPQILKNKKTDIKIISDSEISVKIGNGEYNIQGTNPNCILWFGLQQYQEVFNLEIKWEWIPRNSNETATKMDTLAKAERKKMSQS